VALLWSGAALAQSISAPGLPTPTSGRSITWTPAQWEIEFASKQDYLGYVPLAPATLGVLTGATCNGNAADNTAAIAAFDAAGGGIVPRQTLPAYLNYCDTTIPRSTFAGMFSGPGRIGDSNNNLLGPIYVNISTPPALLGSYSTNAEFTSFNGDFSKAVLAIDYNVTGTALGQPASGTSQPRNVIPIYGVYRLTAGYNSPDSLGRTGASANRWNLLNQGAGDLTGYFTGGSVTSTCSATFPNGSGCPEVSFGAFDLATSVDFGHMEGLGDGNFGDNGFQGDVLGIVQNMNRTNSVGDRNTKWIGYHIHSTGAKPIDAVLNATGPLGIGLDFSGATFPDDIVSTISLSNGGTAYTAGDVLTMVGGTFDMQTSVRVLTVNGGGTILTWALEKAGKYSVDPATPNSPTGGTGSGAIYALGYNGPAILAMPDDSCIFGSASNNSAWGTNFPNTTILGRSRICHSSVLNAWTFVSNNASVLQLASGLISAQSTLHVNAAAMVGTGTLLNLTDGELGFQVITPTGAAGANGAKLTWVCGTSAGTAKLVAHAGTSASQFTVLDNVGAGVTGC
jgi:hypothetical protein